MTTTLDLDFTTGTLDPRITFSRASLGTYYGADGLLKYAAHNLQWPSEDFSSASWTKGGSATVTADAATAPNSTTTADRFNHTPAGTISSGSLLSNRALFQPSLQSVYAKAGTKSWLVLSTGSGSATRNVHFNLASGTVGTVGSEWASAGIQSVGSGWYRCWALTKATSQTGQLLYMAESDVSIVCSGPGDIYIWGAMVEQVTTATTPSTYLPTTTAVAGGPRFDYDPVTHVAKGLLIEEARTNSAQGSQAFDNVNWSKIGVTVLADQIAAPDGTTTADRLTASASSAQISPPALTTAAAASWTTSVYAKKGTSDWFYICAQITGTGAQTPKAYFNLNTGVVGTVEALITAATIQDVGNGWYRCTATSLGTAGVEYPTFGICDADSSATATVGRTIYLWGAQAEFPAAFATSYMPTAPASGANRAADVAVMTGSNFSDWYNQSAGTFAVAFDLLDASGTRVILSADGGTTAEQIMLYALGTDPKALVRDGAVIQADLDVGTIAARTTYKLGISYALNDIAASLNGGAVGTDITATMPTPTQLRIGSDGTNYLTGWIGHVQFQNTALTDAELITVTTPGPWSGGEPVPPAVGPTTTGGAAFWDQYDDREYESSRKRRKRFLDERARRVAELE